LISASPGTSRIVFVDNLQDPGRKRFYNVDPNTLRRDVDVWLASVPVPGEALSQASSSPPSLTGGVEPVGMITALVPCTNPVSTVLMKGLAALKTRNAVMSLPHPRTINNVHVHWS